MNHRSIVPKEFIVPEVFKTEEFILKPLTIRHLLKDFEAVTSSATHLKGLMEKHNDWPVGLTIEENLIDLGWHQREFSLRYSFAYTVLSLTESQCLGCCYIYPSQKPEFEVDAFYWIRQDLLASGLQERLGKAFKTWLKKEWPFTKISFPDSTKR